MKYITRRGPIISLLLLIINPYTTVMAAPSYDMMRPATENYNQALKHQKEGIAHETSISHTQNQYSKTSLKQKAKIEYGKAIEQYQIAIEKKSDFYQAYNGLGYVYFKSGNYKSAIAAFDKALTLKSNYPEAIERRAEVYLEIRHLNRAKAAYRTLAGQYHPDYANLLIQAMEEWLLRIKGQPGKLSEEKRLAFAEWLDKQKLQSKYKISQR